ncbi:hypothetical protein GGR57DRAFT_504780 [Xylariaceae sp. FL1272]|nr:hypothetical protein GGR57DRAFT_504780 [Xylariaceae sp. FL1272]
MGKVHGSLARAGKVKSQTPKRTSGRQAAEDERKSVKRKWSGSMMPTCLTTLRSQRNALDTLDGLLCYQKYRDADDSKWSHRQCFFARIREVDKQEKAKVPKGRAKKRLQYTRRFVNVTLTGGKRKMNPNPGS